MNTIHISSTLHKAAEVYLEASKEPFGKNNIAYKLLVNELPNTIRKMAGINDKYKLQGSAGRGRFVEIPWIAIMNKRITKTVQKGIYIVYLFTSDMKGVYLSLNQGFSYYRDKYGKKDTENMKLVVQYLVLEKV